MPKIKSAFSRFRLRAYAQSGRSAFAHTRSPAAPQPLRSCAPAPLSKKADSEVLSKVIVLLLLISLSVAAYYWGSKLIESQGVRSESEQMSAKLLELRQKITEAANSGNGSARFVSVSLDYGTLSIKPGEPCSGTLPGQNRITYSFSSRSNFAGSRDWSLSDPSSRNMLCTAPYENSSSGVVISRYNDTQGKAENEYALWFRFLNESASSEKFLINISTGGTEHEFSLAKGSHQLRVESQGSYRSGSYTYSKVLISEVSK